ncbi:O-antigen ligase family protein [Campylobacter blaseri]|uniref:O-antigen ligase family protein n=1 Tax=Campylobacter blaseri TaxID=2042961 RepID=UPI0012FFD8DC|nr:O-antigen ligase family protein [Campylobacter blaseri]QKF86322.1 O-antigen ligase family protein [Campylobacter blaseri]
MSIAFNLQKSNRINFEKIYYYLILFLAFASPLSKALNSFNIILLSLVWLIEGDFRRKFKMIKSSNLLLCLMAFLILITISLTYSNLELSLGYFKKYCYLLLIIVIATSVKKEWIGSIITAFLCGMLITEIYALSPLVFDFESSIKTSKIDAQFFNPTMLSIQYSIFLAFCAIIIIEKIFNIKKLNYKTILMFMFLCTTLLNLFLSYSRTGQLIFFVLLIFWTIYRFKINYKAIIALAIALILIFVLAFNYVDNFKKVVKKTENEIALLKKGNFNSSNGIRIALNILSIEVIKDNPFFGVGLGDYEEEYKKLLKKDEFAYMSNIRGFIEKNSPHNQYTFIAMQVGLIGLMVFLLIIYECFRALRRIENEEQRTVFLFFILTFLIAFLTDNQLTGQTTRTLFIIFIGVFSVVSINHKDEKH